MNHGRAAGLNQSIRDVLNARRGPNKIGCRVTLIEYDALGRQPVEVRCANRCIAVAADQGRRKMIKGDDNRLHAVGL